jgi:hypothetical protein
MHATIWLYLWDFFDEGIPHVLDNIQNAGLNSVSVATSYHAGRFILPHNPARKVYFPEDGTIYFHPNWSLYGRIKPQVNTFVHQADVLWALGEEAKRRGVEMVSWTVCMHNSRLGAQHCDCAIRNAFGDHYIHSLCPANEEARHYVIALCQDIAAQESFQIIELESVEYMGFEHGYHHEKVGLPLSDMVTYLLGLCFCDSCANVAAKENVEIEKIKTYAASVVQDCFKGKAQQQTENWWDELMASCDGEFQRYIVMRKNVVTSLVAEIRAAIPQQQVILRPIVSSKYWLNERSGVDLPALKESIGEYNILAYLKLPEDVADAVQAYQKQYSLSLPVTVGLSAMYPVTESKENLVEKVHRCKQLGIERFSFYNYSLMPMENLEWIKEAIR